MEHVYFKPKSWVESAQVQRKFMNMQLCQANDRCLRSKSNFMREFVIIMNICIVTFLPVLQQCMEVYMLNQEYKMTLSISYRRTVSKKWARNEEILR